MASLTDICYCASWFMWERAKERERTGPDRFQRIDGPERTIFGARHNTVSLLCQTGLDRRTDNIGWGNKVFRARSSMLPLEYIAIGTRETHAWSAPLSPLRSRSPTAPTDNDKFVGNIDNDTEDKIRPTRLVPRPVGINSFNERVRVAR